MKEVHEGVCGSHMGGRSLAGKILRARYYRPNMLQDYAEFVSWCEKCQMFASFIHSPAEALHSMFSLWLFYQWG